MLTTLVLEDVKTRVFGFYVVGSRKASTRETSGRLGRSCTEDSDRCDRPGVRGVSGDRHLQCLHPRLIELERARGPLGTAELGIFSDSFEPRSPRARAPLPSDLPNDLLGGSNAAPPPAPPSRRRNRARAYMQESGGIPPIQ